MSKFIDNYWREALEEEVVSIYKRIRATTPNLNHREVCKLVAQQPASRFYISTRYAMNYCQARDEGRSPFISRSYHHSLLEAFYDVIIIELQNPSRYDSFKSIVSRALTRPAPSLGITYRSIERILHRKLHLHHKRPNRK